MSDDIVTELRDWAAITDEAQGEAAVVMLSGRVFTEAADEIERLYGELERWQQIAKTLGDGYSLTDEQRPALLAVYRQFYAESPAVMDAI